MKKFLSFLFLSIIFTISIFSFIGCSNSDIDKVSKNLTNYEISASLDDEKKIIKATEKVDYLNNSGKSLDYVCFHLYPKAFREGAMVKPYTALTEATCFPAGVSFGDIKINKVLINDKEANFEIVGQDENILRINFESFIANQSRIEITIDFELFIPNSTHRFGWYENNINLGNWYPIACIYEDNEFDMSPYFSTGDPFYSDIANYKVEFSFPEKYLISSTGKINVDTKSGVSKAMATARAVRDFAICLSSSSKIERTSSSGVEISYMSDMNDDEILTIIKLIRDAIEFFSRVFGQYPYETLTVAKTPFLYGGMEYPNLVFVSDSIDAKEESYKVIVHEIAHQWWYGIVGNNETKEAWLDESLSEYSAALFFKNHPEYQISYEDFVSQAMSSYMLYVDVISTIKGDVNTKMNLAVNEYQNDYEYSYMVYIKGVIMFDSLKNMVGEDRVISGFKKYYNENKFKIATKQDFFDAFRSACHKDLDGFFEGFLNGSTIISNIN